MSDVAKVRRLSESSTDSEDEENTKKDGQTDVSEMSESDSDSDSSSSSSDSGSDSDGEGDPDNISVGPSTPGSLVGCPVTPGSVGPGSVGAATHHNLSVDDDEHLDDNILSPPQQLKPEFPDTDNLLGIDGHMAAAQSLGRSPGVRDQSLAATDPEDMLRDSQNDFSGDLDTMELDLVGSGGHLVGSAGDHAHNSQSHHHFSAQHSFQNLLEDISTEENIDIPIMTQESDNTTSQLCNLNSQLETEFTATGQDVCEGGLLETGEPGNFSQEDLLQLISTGASSGPGQGFLDPVFVDHEESQNAADLDQIVFEEGQEVDDEQDFLNDPRLGTICSGSNSLGNSERGSINLNDYEDGELPSSPETNINKPQQNDKSTAGRHSNQTKPTGPSNESKPAGSNTPQHSSTASKDLTTTTSTSSPSNKSSSSSKHKSRRGSSAGARREEDDRPPKSDTDDAEKSSGEGKKSSKPEESNHKQASSGGRRDKRSSSSSQKSGKSEHSSSSRRQEEKKSSRVSEASSASMKRKTSDDLEGAGKDSKRGKKETAIAAHTNSSQSKLDNSSDVKPDAARLQNSISTSSVPDKHGSSSSRKSDKRPERTSSHHAHESKKRKCSEDLGGSSSKDKDARSKSANIKVKEEDKRRSTSDHSKHQTTTTSNSSTTSSSKHPNNKSSLSPSQHPSPRRQHSSTPPHCTTAIKQEKDTAAANKIPVKPPVHHAASDPQSAKNTNPPNLSAANARNISSTVPITVSNTSTSCTTNPTRTTSTSNTSKPVCPVKHTTNPPIVPPSTFDSQSSSSPLSASNSGKTKSVCSAAVAVANLPPIKPEPQPHGANGGNSSATTTPQPNVLHSLIGKESPSSEPAQESDDSSSTSCASMNTSGGQGPGGGKPSNKKRLSLKDYKLKRMAEKGSTEIGGTPAGSKQPGDQQKNSSHSNRHKSSGNDTEPSVEPDTNNDNHPPTGLEGFEILDEVKDDAGMDGLDEGGGETSDDDEAVFREVEKGVNKEVREEQEIVPESRETKVIFDKEYLFNDLLPTGWIIVPHKSGMPLYYHKETRVVCLAPPYSLDHTDRVKTHAIPVTAIPCANFKYLREKEEKMKRLILQQQNQHHPSSSAAHQQPSSSDVTESSSSAAGGSNETATNNPDEPNKNQSNDGYLSCPFSGRDNVSPDSTTADNSSGETTVTASGIGPGSSRQAAGSSTEQPDQQPMQVDGEETTAEGQARANKNMLGVIIGTDEKKAFKPVEFQEYCKRLFKFSTVEVNAFDSWKARRTFAKQQKKKAVRNNLPKKGTIMITIPTIELAKVDENQEGDSAINQAVVKKSKKNWVINPHGKSWVCLLNEMLQQSMRCSASFEFQELDNAANPYAATVYVNKIEYGTGVAPSKKLAKARAARRTLEIMIPDFKEKMKDFPDDGTTDTSEDGSEIAVFNDIRIEDPRIAELSNKAGQQGPYLILLSCLQKNYGLIETNVQHEMKPLRNQMHEYTLNVNNRNVSVICKNKKDGKQLAAQKLLQVLHPNITNWGSLLRLYGNRRNILNKKKQNQQEVIALTLKNGNQASTERHHSKAILLKLKAEMKNISEQRRNVIPLGKFHAPSGVNTTGLATDHIDI